MTTHDEIEFRDDGPFDGYERATIRAVHASIRDAEGAEEFVENVRHNIALLDELGGVLSQYPSLFARQSLGRRRRDLSSLVQLLSHSNLSNFEMFLPTRALLGRTLIMAEMNFYRLLRFVCQEALDADEAATHLSRIDGHLCHCIYSRLAGELLTNIASDHRIAHRERKKAVLALLHVLERVTFRIADYLPVLQATWEARRRVKVSGGTLMGVTEMFQLLQAGCDPRFVDLLVSPEHTADEAEAFREFLFGTTTEQLRRLEKGLASTTVRRVTKGGLSSLAGRGDEGEFRADPALAMFEFFLSRHLQAAARRQADLPGPKRTAEEYVMLHYLEAQDDSLLKSIPPAGGE